jgi:hypothetical protein
VVSFLEGAAFSSSIVELQPVTVAARSEAQAFIAWSLLRIPLTAWTIGFVFLCCAVLSSPGVLPVVELINNFRSNSNQYS